MRTFPDKRGLGRGIMDGGLPTEVNGGIPLVDDSNESDEDDDWGVVYSEDLHEVHDRSNHLCQTGVLIISGSDDDGDDGQPYVGRVPVAEVYPTAADLSLPGTLSIPTDPGTLDDEANEIIRRAKERRLTRSNSDIRRKPGFPDRPNRYAKPILIAGTVAILGWITFTVFLLRDRNTWKTSSLSLQQEIRQLKELQEKMAQRNKVKPLPPQQRFSWDETCQSRPTDDEMTLFDNCWVHAKAKVKFGECAAEAQQTIKDWSVTLAETADAVGRAFWNAYFTNSTGSDESTGSGERSQHSSASKRITPKQLKGYFNSVTSQVKKAAKNLKSLGPILNQTAAAAIKGLDEAAKAAVAAGATAGEAVVVASEMATEMMEDFVEVAREVMDDATRTARFTRDR